MEIVIKIPKQMYLNAKAGMLCGSDVLVNAIRNGTPLPKGHGDLIDAYQEMRLMQSCDYDTYEDYSRAFDMLDNAPTIVEADKGGGK